MAQPSAILSPLSPLPLPSVHGAAESPVSAYMRHLNTNSISTMDSKGDPFLGFRPSLSPCWSNLALPPLPGQVSQCHPEGIILSLQQQLRPVPSPMSFGCSTSPKGMVLVICAKEEVDSMRVMVPKGLEKREVEEPIPDQEEEREEEDERREEEERPVFSQAMSPEEETTDGGREPAGVDSGTKEKREEDDESSEVALIRAEE